MRAELFLKAEQFQRGGAFKFRGAYNTVSSLSERELARGVVASSSGNHAQALALAAAMGGTSATIFMPQDAPASKRAATEGYGARVIEFDRYADDREAIVRELVERDGPTPCTLTTTQGSWRAPGHRRSSNWRTRALSTSS